MNIRIRSWSRAPLAAALALAVSCSGSSPTGPVPSVPGPSSPPTAASPSPSPAASPDAASSCRYGRGTVNTFCARGVPAFVSDVDGAIDLLVSQRPELFNLQDAAGDRGYRVLDPSEYYAGVIRNLQARDFCAGFDLAELQLKNGNDFSEQFDILLGSGHIRRGVGAYRSTCTPPNFPLNPEDLIAYVRVAFFGFRCDPGVPVPRNAEGLLPLGCEGNVTATPKNQAGRDVDPRIHGDRIDWRIIQEEPVARVDDFPGVPFNKTLVPLIPGHFQFCATVRGVEGCMNGEVPRP